VRASPQRIATASNHSRMFPEVFTDVCVCVHVRVNVCVCVHVRVNVRVCT